MRQVHCDICKKEIPDTALRLRLMAGVAKGDGFRESETPDDICAACCQKNPYLRTVWKIVKRWM